MSEDYEHVNEILPSLKCDFCLKLLKNAYQCVCSNKVCHSHIEKEEISDTCPVLSKHSFGTYDVMNNTINNLKQKMVVKCLKCEKVCKLNEWETHLSDDCFYPCEFQCDENVKRGNEAVHLETCPNAEIRCCGFKMGCPFKNKRNIVHIHENECNNSMFIKELFGYFGEIKKEIIDLKENQEKILININEIKESQKEIIISLSDNKENKGEITKTIESSRKDLSNSSKEIEQKNEGIENAIKLLTEKNEKMEKILIESKQPKKKPENELFDQLLVDFVKLIDSKQENEIFRILKENSIITLSEFSSNISTQEDLTDIGFNEKLSSMIFTYLFLHQEIGSDYFPKVSKKFKENGIDHINRLENMNEKELEEELGLNIDQAKRIGISLLLRGIKKEMKEDIHKILYDNGIFSFTYLLTYRDNVKELAEDMDIQQDIAKIILSNLPN
eukprot:TRINITY_DN12529_c0_g1_i1.p1 TRINITY_DN12529_c0_g1~~TRINITY_DN12529_c0_g1_i1.p1  ORF type:complete len:444 (-),score=136.99 TRINITY_DN12529_c0_g1_i1:23-1354(-)